MIVPIMPYVQMMGVGEWEFEAIVLLAFPRLFTAIALGRDTSAPLSLRRRE
jgi:hypothetical protein